MDSKWSEQALRLVEGAYDLHVHATPSHDPRSLDDFELVEEATALGMAGVLVKNHYEPTSGRAALVNRRMKGGATLYGSIALNWPVGGINPYAAESAVLLGAKMIWMPTRDSKNSIDREGCKFRPREGLTALDQDGKLKPEVFEVMEVARQHGICVSTGHLTTRESFSVCRCGIDAGVRMVLTHPEFSHTVISVEDQKEFVRMGALIEKDWVDIALGMTTPQAVAQSIREIGAQHIYLATDRGQASGERPAKGMLLYIESLLECGVTPEEIRTMIRTVPQMVLGE